MYIMCKIRYFTVFISFTETLNVNRLCKEFAPATMVDTLMTAVTMAGTVRWW